MCFCFLQAGANMIVSGSAVIGSDDPRSVIALLRTVVSEAIQKRSLDRWRVLQWPPTAILHSSRWKRLRMDFSGVEDGLGQIEGSSLLTDGSVWRDWSCFMAVKFGPLLPPSLFFYEVCSNWVLAQLKNDYRTGAKFTLINCKHSRKVS